MCYGLHNFANVRVKSYPFLDVFHGVYYYVTALNSSWVFLGFFQVRIWVFFDFPRVVTLVPTRFLPDLMQTGDRRSNDDVINLFTIVSYMLLLYAIVVGLNVRCSSVTDVLRRKLFKGSAEYSTGPTAPPPDSTGDRLSLKVPPTHLLGHQPHPPTDR